MISGWPGRDPAVLPPPTVRPKAGDTWEPLRDEAMDDVGRELKAEPGLEPVVVMMVLQPPGVRVPPVLMLPAPGVREPPEVDDVKM